MQPQRKTKIVYKFLLIVLPLVTFSVISTAGVLTWINYRHFRRTIAADYQNILIASGGEISTFMTHGIQDLEVLAKLLSSIKPDLWQQEIALSALHYANGRYQFISLLAPDGRTITSTMLSEDNAIDRNHGIIKKAIAKKSSISSPVQLSEDQLPFVIIAAPVKTMGEVTAVLCAVFDLKHIWEILEDISIGESGEVYIMDLSGQFLAHRDIGKVFKKPPDNIPGIIDQIRRSPQPVTWFEKSDGNTFYSLGARIPGLDWVVALRQPTREIYYYLFRNIVLATLITLLICSAAVFVGWYGIRKFLAPIQLLHRQVQAIGSGNLDQVAGVAATDEIGELARAFNGMTRALREKIDSEIKTAREITHAQNLAVLGTTAGKVTHEVGNLLNNVGMSAAALGNEPLSDQGKAVLAKMDRESDRVRGFIQRFLQFAKPPKLRLRPAAIDLIIREAMAMHAPAAKRQNIVFSFGWPATAPKVLVDTQLIYQAFNNLIKNGIEAMQNQGTLTIAGEVNASQLHITIADDGPGIAPEHLNRIFEPFFTTKGNCGTGLGMAIVKSTVTAHRGAITCNSRPGEGACFQISLPTDG